ncbi:hypothetical protein KJ605_00240 [Patescibacteria group bacterium]|nr:hypothetical protein [Patescibacteria group bacterium]MBU1970198.1 hypothetical protein [Patescibacteria group bacterium]
MVLIVIYPTSDLAQTAITEHGDALAKEFKHHLISSWGTSDFSINPGNPPLGEGSDSKPDVIITVVTDQRRNRQHSPDNLRDMLANSWYFITRLSAWVVVQFPNSMCSCRIDRKGQILSTVDSNNG